MTKIMAYYSENTHPNVGTQTVTPGGFAFSSLSSSSAEKSEDNGTKLIRRKIKIPAHKRKAAEAALMDITEWNKRPQLQLRDEEDLSTVEAAAQPRRGQ